MRVLTLKITTLSETLINSGEGWGATIDADVVFDECGLPYIPAKRIKGCLRESAIEVAEMMEMSGINSHVQKDVEILFGKRGDRDSSPISFDNLYLEDYEINKNWLQWAVKEFSSLLSRETILHTFTSLRQQTAIADNGIAIDKSLRTSRVLRKNITFVGMVRISDYTKDIDLLCLAALNLRYIGSKRNRGLGYIRCGLYNDTEVELSKDCLNQWEKMEVKDVSN